MCFCILFLRTSTMSLFVWKLNSIHSRRVYSVCNMQTHRDAWPPKWGSFSPEKYPLWCEKINTGGLDMEWQGRSEPVIEWKQEFLSISIKLFCLSLSCWFTLKLKANKKSETASWKCKFECHCQKNGLLFYKMNVSANSRLIFSVRSRRF